MYTGPIARERARNIHGNNKSNIQGDNHLELFGTALMVCAFIFLVSFL